MRALPYRWLNAFLLLVLAFVLYLVSTYSDEDLRDYYHQHRAQQELPADLEGSISAR